MGAVGKRLNAGFVSAFVFSSCYSRWTGFLSDSHSDGTHSLPLLRHWVPSENVLMLDLFQLLSSQAVITDGLGYCDVFIRLSF